MRDLTDDIQLDRSSLRQMSSSSYSASKNAHTVLEIAICTVTGDDRRFRWGLRVVELREEQNAENDGERRDPDQVNTGTKTWIEQVTRWRMMSWSSSVRIRRSNIFTVTLNLELIKGHDNTIINYEVVSKFFLPLLIVEEGLHARYPLQKEKSTLTYLRTRNPDWLKGVLLFTRKVRQAF